jgi:uncharacterized repeat protein (TIGR01451 family)
MPATRSSPHRPGAVDSHSGDGRSPGRRGVRVGLAAILALAVMAVAAPAAVAAPWACDGTGYITRWDQDPPPQGTNGNTQFLRAVRQPDESYAFQLLGAFAQTHVNALGFRPHDGFMYAYNNPTGQVMRIGRDPATGQMDVPTAINVLGIPAGFNTVIGTILADGRYLMIGNTGAGTPTIGVLVNLETNVAQVLAVAPNAEIGSDIAVSPIDNNIYTSNPNGLYELAITGGTLTTVRRVTNGVTSGAQWFVPDGRMVQYNNANGTMWITDLATGSVSRIGTGAEMSNVDGTACANGIALTKDATPRRVLAGTEVTYTYTLTSRALVEADLNFVDTLPAGLTYVPDGVTVAPAAAGTLNAYGGQRTLRFTGSILPNRSITITARVLVSPDHACDVDASNQAQVTMRIAGLPPVTVNSDDPLTDNDPTDPTDVRVICRADVEVVKLAPTSPVVPGEETTFTFVATNNGPSTARDVVVSDQLPAEFSFRSASQGCAESGGRLTCTVGTLGVGQSQTFTATGVVASSVEECLENTATVTSTTPDANQSNNSSTVCPPPHPRADLALSKVASHTTVPAGGGQVMYTLVVRNLGPSHARGVEVRDALAPGLTIVAANASQGSCSTAGNVVACDLGTIRDGGSAHVLVTVNVAGLGCIRNVAFVQSGSEDRNAENNTGAAEVCVNPPPPPPPRHFDLAVTKTASDRSLLIGQRVTYRVTVRNNGPDTAPNVELTDTINAPVTVVSVRTTQGSCERRIPMRCELGTIAAGDSVRITIVAKHRQAGRRQRQAASATGDGTDTNQTNNTDTVDVRVRKVRLVLSKVANRSAVDAGDTFGYRIRVRNPTRGEARNVKVCDRLPSGLAYVSSKPRARRQGARRHCWTIRRVGARQSRTYAMTVRAARGAIGRKTNTATMSSPSITRRVRARDVVRVRGVATPVTG